MYTDDLNTVSGGGMYGFDHFPVQAFFIGYYQKVPQYFLLCMFLC